ncbi:MAG: U32 family peptidase, partial [Clostridia bacterium]|nr:U32 family peptidase [Clostridia bacterium]
MKKPELLCPVGGADTLQAALLGGADAVYFGGSEFNARMNAKNFSNDEIRRAVSKCHEKGVRVYVTLNTLLTDRNIAPALEFVGFLYGAGCDGLILADVGFSSLLKDSFPGLELHGSTQMSGHSVGAAEFLKDRGFSRMVLARELDRESIAVLCQKSPIETELFVHGAICASASGQCLMSSMIGDRSGNRGECAQPCRLPYNGGKYPISFRDLCLAKHVPELIKMGISSLKIEGRMKSPEYVYTVARIWRTLLDENRAATDQEMSRLAGIFSRSGFTDGYYTKKLSSEMLGTRTEQDKQQSAKERIRFADSGRLEDSICISRPTLSPEMPLLPKKTKPRFHRSARFQKADQIPETDFFHEIYLPLEAFEGTRANGVLLPPVIFPGEEEKIRKQLKIAYDAGARHAMVGNIGHLRLLEGFDFVLHGDFRLNVTNSFSLNSYPTLSDVVVSPELNTSQIRDLRGEKCTIVYGRIPVMLLEKDPDTKLLCDRKGIKFPVLQEGERFIVYNSVPFYMADKKKLLKEKGIEHHHYIFSIETKQEIIRLI